MTDKLEIIEIIVAFNELIVGKQTVHLFDRNHYQNDLTIGKDIKQITVSYKLSQIICFTQKLHFCTRYRRTVFNHLKSIIKQNSSNEDIDRFQHKNDQNLSESNSTIIRIFVKLKSIDDLVIDKLWNKCVLSLVVIRFQIEDSLAWLSTLGGAYSSLGDRNIQCAIKAGQISISQLRLASICGDPNVIARCGIYLVYSLCQQGKRSGAIKLIKETLYPYISRIVNCDKIVKSMYAAVCYRVRHFYKY